MNKLFIVLFAVAAVSFSACGGSAKTETNTDAVEETVDATVEQEVAVSDSIVSEVVDSAAVKTEEVKEEMK